MQDHTMMCKNIHFKENNKLIQLSVRLDHSVLNFLSILSDLPLIEKLTQTNLSNFAKILNDKICQITKCQMAFFFTTINLIIQN